ncbi:DMT family transporter [Tolypothrix sp. VBCCA 56010]|uniref:DMT family transporter n=1 Tax=Tolypothrix sp. VBCCA 56010 TaxID=3137731 RepID=UPI003D7D5327
MTIQYSSNSQKIGQLSLSVLEKSPDILKKESNNMAIAAILLAVGTLAFTPILIRSSQTEVGADASIFNRYWIATTFLLLWNSLRTVRRFWIKSQNLSSQLDEQTSSPISYTSQTVSLLLVSGLFLAATTVLWSWSLTQTNVANSALIHNFSIFFTTTAEWLFFKQRFHKNFLMGGAIAVGGIILLGLNDLQFELDNLQGDIVSFVSSIAFCGFLMSAERVRDRVSATTTIFWWYGIGIILTLPLALINHEQLFPISWQGWSSAIVLGFNAVIVHFLEIYSLRKLSASFVALVFLLDPILTSIFAWWIFGETLPWLNLLAFSVILVGLYLAISSPSVAMNFEGDK